MPVSNNLIVTTEPTSVVENETSIANELPSVSVMTDEGTTQSPNHIQGLSEEEQKDPNSIRVTIADTKVPIVVLFGPPSCGKTMTLIRMTRFLRSEGYTVTPIRTFRPTSDKAYTRICDNFDETINSDNAAESTDRISFMLVDVIKNGRSICQILEAPGEHYFDPKDKKEPKSGFPNYVNTIITCPNRKIWTIIVEPDWMDQTDRNNYVTKINTLKINMGSNDSTIFVFNKIDATNFVRNKGNIYTAAAISNVKNLYPDIFVPFINQNPITRFWKEYNCDFVPFQTGFYTKAVNGITYQAGPQEYCVKLWKSIMKNLIG